MTRFKTLINMVLTLLIFVNGAHASEGCNGWRATMDKISNLELLNVEDILSSNPDVLLIGEHHLHNLSIFLPIFLEGIKKKSDKYNCMLFELHPEDDLPPRFVEFQNIAHRFGYSTHKIDSGVDLPVWANEFLENRHALYENDREQYDKMMDQLLQYIEATMGHRDDEMAKNIHNLLESGACTGAIYLVGSAHIFNDSNINDPSPQPTRLSAHGISYKTFLLQETLTYLTGTGLGGPQTYIRLLDEALSLAKSCMRGDDLFHVSNIKMSTSVDSSDSVGNDYWDGMIFVPQIPLN